MKKFKLNKVQKEAVESIEKPSLIFAGAGTGKTRVLTHKIAFLIDEKGYNPSEILAVTFTNKAAQEMQNRVKLIIGNNIKSPNIGTFHSICARFLREEINLLGFNSNFAIYDTSDQDMLIKSIINSQKIPTNGVTVPTFRSQISYFKSKLINPISFLEKSNNPFDISLSKIFPHYMKELKENNAVDFSDLLLFPLQIFEKFPKTLNKYQNKFKYILVDEYQDTNEPQFHFVKYLSEKHKNITVVGDDDQSIYGWRGADISNILNFEKTFPNCDVFKLEQNYRSSGNILAVATNVVANNLVRSKKTLWTEKEDGDKIGLMETFDELEEIDGVIELIQKEIHQNKRSFSDFVILYRTNAQSRAIEDGLRRKAISYEIVGGIKFYERKEIKDLLAYLRVLVNPSDTISLKRIMNFPPRGIGAKTIEKCEYLAFNKNLPLLEILKTPEEMNLKGQQAAGLIQFHQIIKKYSELKDKFDASELASVLVEELGLINFYNEQNTEDAKERLRNIQELLTTIHQFCEKNTNSTISEFLEEVSLLTSIDSWNDSTNHITLMTVHSAKGLEFPIVFITGLEDGLFPLSNSFDDPKKMEEERRLFYVAVTRAEEKAFLHYATNRRRSSGASGLGQPSRFVNEISSNFIERLNFQSAMTRRLVKEKNSDKYKLKYIRTITSFNEFERGDKVEHPIFGKGMILAVDGSGDNQKITVVFQGNIEKRLIGKYANLKPLK
tara:strand:+ start:1428 stop:3599 length:2172 start_codon:yes stop_codon:yes gene_type:complete